jgi:hypothetical protein
MAVQTGAYTYAASMDNYEPVRDQADGTVEVWQWPDTGEVSYRIPGGVSRFLKDTRHVIFLMDDGATVAPLYLAGWSQRDDTLFLQSFPVNVDTDGNPRMRGDNGRPVDFRTWMLGPQRAYHLKVTAL